MVCVYNVFHDYLSNFNYTGYSILKSVDMPVQVIFAHNKIVFQGAITVFVGLQAL